MSGTDTLYQQLREHLHTLGLHAAADRLAPALNQADRDQPGYTEFLHEMLTYEVAALAQRRLQGRLRFAKLPARKTLEQFDYSAQPGLDRRLIDDLATLRFVQEKDVLCQARAGIAVGGLSSSACALVPAGRRSGDGFAGTSAGWLRGRAGGPMVRGQ